jgi:integrase
LVRAPRFEPGSSAWQADVLDHCSGNLHHDISAIPITRLRALNANNQTIQQLKPIPQEIDSRIANTLIKAQNDALSDITLKSIEYSLKQLAQHSNLLDPEDVKHYISTAKTKRTQQAVAAETKNKWLFCYDRFCKYNNIQWTKPYYKVEEKAPLIPTRDNVTTIIANASYRFATPFTILAETGCSPHELENVTRNDIDTQQGIISIRGTKGHASGNYKLKTQTAEMLRQYLTKYNYEKPFPPSTGIRQVWIDTRRRTAKKLSRPELDKIPCKNLRNYSGAQLYLNSPVRDPIAVMRHLRHKKLETTMHYLRAIVLDAEEEYTCREATTKAEAMKLIDEGFTYQTTIEGAQLFRKRK